MNAPSAPEPCDNKREKKKLFSFFSLFLHELPSFRRFRNQIRHCHCSSDLSSVFFDVVVVVVVIVVVLVVIVVVVDVVSR